ncbi:MAG: helix-turn-helix domain-containing protein [Pseudomonadota bacterium]|nr:helix-turn-helix domain-containing protein [Pseudomonadota bacterium]
MSELTYSIAELEGVLKLSHRKLYDLLTSGELPSYKIGKRRFVRAESLEEFLRNREKETTFRPDNSEIHDDQGATA